MEKPSLNQKSFLMTGLRNTTLAHKYTQEELYKAVSKLSLVEYNECIKGAIPRNQFRKLEEDLLKLK